jgi:hypothetical protein
MLRFRIFFFFAVGLEVGSEVGLAVVSFTPEVGLAVGLVEVAAPVELKEAP